MQRRRHVVGPLHHERDPGAQHVSYHRHGRDMLVGALRFLHGALHYGLEVMPILYELLHRAVQKGGRHEARRARHVVVRLGYRVSGEPQVG